MEHARFGQIAKLKEQGWTVDEECQKLQRADQIPGGSTYMKSPDGRMHGVGTGNEEPLDGFFDIDMGALGTRAILYADGLIIGRQG